jgi:hypothetical protein
MLQKIMILQGLKQILQKIMILRGLKQILQKIMILRGLKQILHKIFQNAGSGSNLSNSLLKLSNFYLYFIYPKFMNCFLLFILLLNKTNGPFHPFECFFSFSNNTFILEYECTNAFLTRIHVRIEVWKYYSRMKKVSNVGSEPLAFSNQMLKRNNNWLF